MVVLTAEQTRAAEAAAMQNGLSALQLMENAGQAAAKVIAEHYEVLKKMWLFWPEKATTAEMALWLHAV